MRHIIFGLLLVSNFAFAGISLIPAGGINLSNPKYTPAISGGIKSKMAIAGGLGIELGFSRVFSFETGGYYAQRKYSATVSSIELITTLPAVVIPAMFRFHLGNFFSIGAGGYAALAMGKVKVEALGLSTETAYDLAGVEDIDYGAMASLTLELPMSKSISFVVDGRYLLGIKDINKDPAVTTKMTDIQALAGFRFQLSPSK